MKHLDLFSGIGGFAYAADQVFGDVEHVFCDNDKFCQKVLKKHWEDADIYDDIATITDTERKGWWSGSVTEEGQTTRSDYWIDLLTGGFPCQPFSAAGVRRGTSDDRYLWPQMLKVIRITQPTWIIAENVRGLLTWEQGLVVEQVCLDLEALGYDVQPLIIPALAVNAPHRRDRIWFIAHSNGSGRSGSIRGITGSQDEDEDKHRSQDNSAGQFAGANKRLPKDRKPNQHAPNSNNRRSPKQEQPSAGHQQRGGGVTENSISQRSRGRNEDRRQILGSQSPEVQNQRPSWESDWLEIATEFCGVDDGLSVELDGFKLTKSQNRANQLKAYGNAIVPQVAIEIMKGMVYETL